ncbi:MFS transporter [Bacillus sp. FJAT-26390]|uniref:MFS transporter n=1 Tax=Bacillus sp. FJAT-26390 TaxID=1743142 RepID=UPI0008080ED5|nr:MFS transporter [Bacillus sp. FJAT-26390]OBZ16369.1 MFS sugar transporter [Bacillus sp. FJAT-26390]
MNSKIYVALISLAVSAFAIGTTEFVIVGLLQEVAADLGITVTKAGTLISGYAVAIAIGTPVVVVFTGKLPKKGYLIFLMLVFTAGNVLSTLAPSYTVLLISRVITAVAHGVFFAVAATVAADMVPTTKKGTAISIMFTGLTVATILGVPLGTYIGQQFGWRMTFVAVAGLGLIALLVNLIAVDKVQRSKHSPTLKDVGCLIVNPRIIMALLMTVLGFGATFALFTYISPILEEISGYSASSISWLLLVYGVAVAIGNIIGGKLANGHPVKALRFVFLFQAIALLLQIWLLPSKTLSILSLILMGLFAFIMSPGVQAYILILAEKLVPSAKELASALNISAFNIGIAVGSTLGGVAVEQMHIMDTAWIGAIMAGFASFLAVINYMLDKKQNIFR